MKTITREELVDILRGTKCATFASITYKVDESKSRTVAGRKVLQKVVTVPVTLNSLYEAKVNRILENKQGEEGGFVAQEMKGKVPAFDGCKCLLRSEKDGGLMLYAAVENKAKPDTRYFHEGKEISKEEAMARNLFAPSAFAEKPTMGRGEVEPENDFHLISPKLSGLMAITLLGETYILA